MSEHDQDPSFQVDLQAADDLAAAAMREEGAAPAAPAAATAAGPPRRYVGLVVTVIGLVVFVTQLPSLRAAFQSPPSIRIGAADADEDTDACVDTLWKVSGLLQYGSFRGGEWVEPVTQRPYVVRQTEGDTVVECPNPGAHNLRSLHVSSAHRAPEAKR